MPFSSWIPCGTSCWLKIYLNEINKNKISDVIFNSNNAYDAKLAIKHFSINTKKKITFKTPFSSQTSYKHEKKLLQINVNEYNDLSVIYRKKEWN